MIDFHDKTILVTGGTGFIGGRIVERLVLEHKSHVRVLVHNFMRASRIGRFDIQMIQGDITSQDDVEKAVAGSDIIFHCAYGNRGDVDMQRRVNVDGTENIMRAARRYGVSRVVHVSTAAVYGNQKDGEFDETCPQQYSGDVYADTKLDGERIAVQYAEEHQVPVSIVQPTVVYGPWAPSWTVSPLQKLRTHRIVLVNGGDGLCNAVYIDDLIQAMFLAATKQEALGETFIISGPPPITWREFYGAYAQMVGVSPFIEMSLEQIIHSQSQKSKKSGTLAQIIQVYRKNPQVRQFIHDLPLVAQSLFLLRKCISDDAWEMLKRKTRNEQVSSSIDGHVELEHRPVHLPTVNSAMFLASKACAKIDKATQLLGYIPLFDFGQGLEITKKWAKWVNLV